MLTNQDILKLSTIFSTKQDTENLVTKSEFKAEITQLRNEILDLFDKVFGDLKLIHEEQLMHRQEHEDIESRFILVEAHISP